MLDLYAGAGAMGIEALRRGAAFARFVERDRRQCAAIRKALRAAGLQDQAAVSCATVMKYLQVTEETFDLAIADPPYAAAEADGALRAIAARRRPSRRAWSCWRAGATATPPWRSMSPARPPGTKP